jgi:MFS family permease
VTGGTEEDPAGRWTQLAVIATGVLLAFAPWFSASAVAPLLAAEWHTTRLDLPLLTVAVQLGFAAGALSLAATGAADAVPARRLFAVGAVIAAAGNLGFATLADGPTVALAWRFATGIGLAAVYPIALKMLAGWFRRGRGFAIGILIGALTVGSALPHLIRAVGVSAGADWRATVAAASGAAIVGGVLVAVAARSGPFEPPAPRFSPAIAAAALREPSVRLANLGYLGHMWELYAMWTWMAVFVTASEHARRGPDADVTAGAALVTFAVVGSGAIGCWLGGRYADRWGRTLVTSAAMVVSGSCAIAVGWFFGGSLSALIPLLLVWGIAVVADSAQFSAAVSELAPRDYVGTALTLQTSLGFLLTCLTIYLLPLAAAAVGWRWSMSVLAIGPAFGVWAMLALRRRPEALQLAGGAR